MDNSDQSKHGNAKLLSTGKVPAAAYDDPFLSDSDDDSLQEIECKMCHKSFTSVKVYEQHLNSKKHHQSLTRKKLMQKVGKEGTRDEKNDESEHVSQDEEDVNELFCDICKKTICGYTPYLAHLKGSGHAKILKQQRLKESLKNLPEVFNHDNRNVENSEDDDLMPKPFAECSKCQKTFYGPEALQQHLKGPAHKKKLKNLKSLDSLKSQDDCAVSMDNEEFSCTICKKCFSGPVPYRIHLKSSVHKKEQVKAQIEEQMKDHFKRDESGLKLICKECERIFTDPFSFKSHLENNSHAKKRARDVVFGFVSENPDIVAVKALQNLASDEECDEREDYQPGQYFLVCKLCHMSFSGPQSARDHLKSKRHIKVKTEKKEMKMFKQKLKQTKDSSPNEEGSSVKLTEKTLSKTNGVDAPTTLEADHKLQRSDENDDFELI